jgi:hypothetical protein
VVRDLLGYGFCWFDAARPEELRRYLADPDPALLDTNQRLAQHHFSLDDLPAKLKLVVDGLVA